MPSMNKTIKSIILIATLISIVFGVNSYFAKASDMKMVEMRLDYKIESDVFNSMRERS